jgi:hypothetical protein
MDEVSFVHSGSRIPAVFTFVLYGPQVLFTNTQYCEKNRSNPACGDIF